MAVEGAQQPRARERPVAFDSGGGDLEHIRGFLDRQADEVAEIHDPGFLGGEGGQGFERVVQPLEIEARVDRRVDRTVQRDSLNVGTAALLRAPVARVNLIAARPSNTPSLRSAR